jgi:hypothetical protein
MNKKQKIKFKAKVYLKALALCGDKDEAERRSDCAVEVRQWRLRHDRHMKELKAIQKERLKH